MIWYVRYRLNASQRRQRGQTAKSAASMAAERLNMQENLPEVKSSVQGLAGKPARRRESIVDKTIAAPVGSLAAYVLSLIGWEVDMKGNWSTWAKAAGIRALKTVAQTAIATIGTAAVFAQVDWVVVASASAMAGILSLLTSVAGLPEVKSE